MKIGIHGINGKMGLAIAHEIMAHPDLELGAASVRNGHEWAGKRLCDVAPDLPDCTVRITSNLDQFCAPVMSLASIRFSLRRMMSGWSLPTAPAAAVFLRAVH